MNNTHPQTNNPEPQKTGIKAFFRKYERHASWIAFIAGFTSDNLMLRRIDLLVDQLLLFSYLLVAGAGIILYNKLDSSKPRSRFTNWIPFFIQFAFGALFSGFFVFYSRSASLVASWPFVLFLLTMLFGNEHLRHHYSRLTLQLSIYFIVAFSFSIFMVPTLTHSMGPVIFVISGLVSLLIIRVMMRILRAVAPDNYMKGRAFSIFWIIVIYATFNILYFKNIIPPIPLSLKDIGIYHNIEKSPDGNYTLTYEHRPWYDLKNRFTHTFHYEKGESVYAYSAIFAPTKLNTVVLHKWSYFDETRKVWVETNSVAFPIVGGADGGYRGYTIKTNIQPGKWRVDVTTARDQLLGRIQFTVASAEKAPELLTKVR